LDNVDPLLEQLVCDEMNFEQISALALAEITHCRRGSETALRWLPGNLKMEKRQEEQ
jgi:hypothetical protein